MKELHILCPSQCAPWYSKLVWLHVGSKPLLNHWPKVETFYWGWWWPQWWQWSAFIMLALLAMLGNAGHGTWWPGTLLRFWSIWLDVHMTCSISAIIIIIIFINYHLIQDLWVLQSELLLLIRLELASCWLMKHVPAKLHEQWKQSQLPPVWWNDWTWWWQSHQVSIYWIHGCYHAA